MGLPQLPVRPPSQSLSNPLRLDPAAPTQCDNPISARGRLTGQEAGALLADGAEAASVRGSRTGTAKELRAFRVHFTLHPSLITKRAHRRVKRKMDFEAYLLASEC